MCAGNLGQLINPYHGCLTMRILQGGCILQIHMYSVGLFTNQANFDNLTARLSVLLQVSNSADDGLSKFTCQLCRDILKNLEEKLAAKRSAVRVVYQHAGYVIGA